MVPQEKWAEWAEAPAVEWEAGQKEAWVAASPRKTESESRNRRAARSTAEPFLPWRIEYRKRNVPFFTCEKKGTFVLL